MHRLQQACEKAGNYFFISDRSDSRSHETRHAPLKKLSRKPELRTAVKKDGPVITDQDNFVLDVKLDGIDNPAELEKTIHNIPGVLNNGLFVGLADLVACLIN